MNPIYNWKSKLGSLILAIGLLFYVQLNQTATRDIQVRITKPRLPRNLVLASKLPAYLNVRLKGPRELMDLPVSDFRIRLSNPHPRPLENKPNLFRTVLKPELPEGVIPEFTEGLEVLIEPVRERRLRVAPRVHLKLSGEQKRGYGHISPRTIRIRGPRSVVDKMEHIDTEDIFVESPGNHFYTRVFIQLPSFVTTAQGEPLDVEYNMSIIKGGDLIPEGLQRVEIKDLTVKCSGGAPGGYSIEPTIPLDVIVELPLEEKPPLLKGRRRKIEARAYCKTPFNLKLSALKKELLELEEEYKNLQDKDEKKEMKEKIDNYLKEFKVEGVSFYIIDLKNRNYINFHNVSKQKLSLTLVKKKRRGYLGPSACDFIQDPKKRETCLKKTRR